MLQKPPKQSIKRWISAQVSPEQSPELGAKNLYRGGKMGCGVGVCLDVGNANR